MAAVIALAAVAVVITKNSTFGLNGMQNSVIPLNPFSFPL
jgi:hypothetical protein